MQNSEFSTSENLRLLQQLPTNTLAGLDWTRDCSRARSRASLLSSQPSTDPQELFPSEIHVPLFSASSSFDGWKQTCAGAAVPNRTCAGDSEAERSTGGRWYDFACLLVHVNFHVARRTWKSSLQGSGIFRTFAGSLRVIPDLFPVRCDATAR